VEMVGRLERGEGLDGVAGLVFREGGGIRANAPRPLAADLDELPFPDRKLLATPTSTFRLRPCTGESPSRSC